MNFFKIPRDNVSRHELNELVHLYQTARANESLSAPETARRLLDEFHSRQNRTGISDMRMHDVILMSYPALNRTEREFIPSLTDSLMNT